MFFRLLLIIKKFISKILSISLLCLSFVACQSSAFAENPKILVYGDSLSAAYGIAQQQGWCALLQKKLNNQYYQYDVINASISGETTSGGLSRLEAILVKSKPNIVILELGANDGLRGLPLREMTSNLSAMITMAKKSKTKILLIGMRIPPNYGPKYTETFSNAYQLLSQKHQIPIVPFMLENIAAKPELIQDDGLHPNVLGQPMILDNIWPKLKLMLNKKTN
jgi:acyl-CoA thioesterase-1